MSNRYQITNDGYDLYLEGGILESKYYIGPYPMDDAQCALARKRLKLLLEHPLFDNTLEGYEIDRLFDTRKRNMIKKYGRSLSMNKYNCDKYVISIAYGPEMYFIMDAYSCDDNVNTYATISSINAEAFTKGIKRYMERHGLRSMKVESVHNLEAYCSRGHGVSIKRIDGEPMYYTITRTPPARKPDEKEEEKPSENTLKPLTDEEITLIREIIAKSNAKASRKYGRILGIMDYDPTMQNRNGRSCSTDAFSTSKKPETVRSDEEYKQKDHEFMDNPEEGIHTPEASTDIVKTNDLRNGELVIIKADKSKLPKQFNYLAEWYYFKNDVTTWMRVPDVYKALAKYYKFREEFVTVFGDHVYSKDVISVSKVEPEWFGN